MSGGGGFGLRVDLAGLEGQLDADADVCTAAARPAAQAGAQVLYDAVRANVGRLRRHTGKLADAIYQAYSKDNSEPGKAAYHVSWNAKKAPHGHLVEFGHLQRYEISYDPVTKRFTTHKDKPLPAPKLVAAQSFVRKAWASHADAAEQAVIDRYFEELEKAGVVRA